MDLQIQEIGKQSVSMYYPFHLSRTYKLSTETLNCVDWSRDGWSVFSEALCLGAFDSLGFSLVVAGGEDHIVRVVGAEDYRNLFIHPLAAHQGAIVMNQFMNNNYDVSILSAFSESFNVIA